MTKASEGSLLWEPTERRRRGMEGPVHRHAGDSFPVALLPGDQHRLETEYYRENGAGYFLTTDIMRWFWSRYLESEEIRSDMLASPLLTEEAAGCSPAFVVTAEFNSLRDEEEAYAELLREAGNEVTSGDMKVRSTGSSPVAE